MTQVIDIMNKNTIFTLQICNMTLRVGLATSSETLNSIIQLQALDSNSISMPNDLLLLR